MIHRLKSAAYRSLSFCARVPSRARNTAFVVLATVGAATASAQYTPPTFDDIVFPIDTATIATTVGAAGAAILVLAMGWKGGFRMVAILFRKLFGAIR